MKKAFIYIITLTIFSFCTKKEPVDTIVINAKIFTVNTNFDIVEAFSTNKLQTAYELKAHVHYELPKEGFKFVIVIGN